MKKDEQCVVWVCLILSIVATLGLSWLWKERSEMYQQSLERRIELLENTYYSTHY